MPTFNCTMKTSCLFLCTSLAFSLPALSQTTNSLPVLQIDASQVTAQVSPVFSGMMTEEINHSYDGGLYGELIQNRAFKDDASQPIHWEVVQDSAAMATMKLDFNNGLNEQLPVSLRLDTTTASDYSKAGVANEGFWGIPVRPHTHYHASFYAKAAGFDGPVQVRIESTDGETVFAEGTVKKLTGEWQKYSVTLTTTKKDDSDERRPFCVEGQFARHGVVRSGFPLST